MVLILVQTIVYDEDNAFGPVFEKQDIFLNFNSHVTHMDEVIA